MVMSSLIPCFKSLLCTWRPSFSSERMAGWGRQVFWQQQGLLVGFERGPKVERNRGLNRDGKSFLVCAAQGSQRALSTFLLLGKKRKKNRTQRSGSGSLTGVNPNSIHLVSSPSIAAWGRGGNSHGYCLY